MLPDAECVKIVIEILRDVGVGDFRVVINHRKILDGIFELCGVPPEKFRTICSSIDKLDKTFWDDVRAEMIDEKGVSPEIADAIGTHIQLSGKPTDVIATLKAKEDFMSNSNARSGLESVELMFKYCELMGIDSSLLIFNLSLARGLDYYTGVIFEAILIRKSS